MAADEKLLVVVGIHEGRGFPSKSRHDLVIEIQFAGETLQSDPVDHSIGGHIVINNELAWEMTRKSLQEHKLQRTPIRLICYCVNRATQKRTECGTVMLDLRSVQQSLSSTSLVSHWYSLLRCQYNGKRPELKLSLTSETENTTQLPPPPQEDNSGSLTPPLSSLPPLILDEGNGWYLLGTPNPQQILHTVSLTLSQPHNLCNVSRHTSGSGNYIFKYNILGNEIITEEFTSLTEPCDFQAERASVRIKGTPKLIKELLLSQSDIQIDLLSTKSGGVVLASGSVPIKPLADSQHFSVSCSLSNNKGTVVGGDTTPTVNVTLALHYDKSNEILQLSSSSSTHSLSNSVTTDNNKAKRNLAQSFEEVSNSSNVSVSIAPPTDYTSKIHTSPRPSSPAVTPPSAPSPPRVTFTSPKTSPLLLSQSMSPRHSPVIPPPPSYTTSPSLTTNTITTFTTCTTSTTTSNSSTSINSRKEEEDRGKGTVVFSKPGGIRPHPPNTRPHPPTSTTNSASHIQQQLEYKSAMELEIWKMNQEELFKKELKEREEVHMKLLTEEFQKRDKHRETVMKQKLEHYQSLETQLAKTLKELDTQRQKLKTREYEMSSAQRRLEDERRSLQFDIEREKNVLQTGMEGSLQIEKLKSKELSLQLDRARRQVTELETKLTQKEFEFETYKGKNDKHTESQLQAELGLLKLEKTELEHKLETTNKSKLHYKEQWSKALKEIASLKHREQTVLRDQLKKQQIELENMREKYLVAEEQQSLQKQLQHLKDETHRLRAHTLSAAAVNPPPPSHRIPTPSPPRLHNIDSNIARWIEERNILLQTGVYTHSDSTIQKLDRKIQEALLDKKSQHDFSS